MKKISFSIIIVALITIPYWLAWIFQGDLIFSGMLFNPTDGFSYLAKIRQGWEGNWKFYLPYSAEKGGGAYIFFFYLFLGHIARLLQISPALIFHIARIAGSIFLIWSLFRLLQTTFMIDRSQISGMMTIICLGAGLGWVGLFFGKIWPDFWVAEAYPFLSMFANPHFPTGLALMALIFSVSAEQKGRMGLIALAGLGITLSIVLPFGFTITALVLIILMVWNVIKKRKTYITNIAAIILPGGLWLGYQYAAILNDPVLYQWNLQNITPSPTLLELLAAFSPALPAALLAIVFSFRKNERSGMDLPVIWVVVSFLSAIAPFDLQRRFLAGIFIPLGILAVMALNKMSTLSRRTGRLVLIAVITLSIPTNLITLAIFSGAGLGHEKELFITKNEQAAFAWMQENIPEDSLCLSGIETGLLIPAYSHCRVLYGHPFESNEEELQGIEKFYDPITPASEKINYLASKEFDFILWSKRDTANLPGNKLDHTDLVFNNNEVQIYRVLK